MMQQMVFALVLGLSLHNPVGLLAQDSSAPQPVVETAPASTVADAASAGRSTTPAHETEVVDYWSLLFVFVLAAFIGLGVIGRVSRLLHTPLMSLTNAISAIAVVGSIVVTGSDYPESIRFLGAIALFASMTNIVSGFLITDRMLKMFKQTRQPEKP
jgi:NAD(P) transhydrogenase subunit alpha